MPRRPQPKVAYALVSDTHKVADSGKTDAFGIFDKFLVWATPTTRECSLVVRIDNLAVGTSSCTVYSVRAGRAIKTLAKLDVASDAPKRTTLLATRLRLNFAEPGEFKLGIGPTGGTHRSIHWLPLSIELQPWPELPTGDKLAALLEDPQTIKAARVGLRCEKCGRSFTFGLHLDPNEKLPRGLRPFPGSGTFKCPKCAALHHLRDVEGQLRMHLGQQPEGASK
jgi:hypothetical protein